MKVPYLDFSESHNRISDALGARISKIFDHKRFVLGPEVKELEESLADLIGVAHCVGCASGTDALVAALMSLDVGKGDEVITSPFTYFASIEAILLVGAKPIFVDIDESFNIDPELIPAAITKHTKVILPVSIFGKCIDLRKISEVAKTHELSVIEDAAQSFGAKFDHQTNSCGLSSDIACTSFYPTKPLGCYGDGGAIFCNDGEIESKLRQIISHGETSRNHHERLGFTGRLDSIQAAVLLEKLKFFDHELSLRESVAQKYDQEFTKRDLPLKKAYRSGNPGEVMAWAQYAIRLESRDELRSFLSERDVPTSVFYPLPAYKQAIYQSYYPNEINLSTSEKACNEVLCLPFFPDMQADQIEFVVETISDFFGR